MSRGLLLNLSEAEAIKACGEQGVAISVIEKLDSGGVRLVCLSTDGAAAMHHMLRAKLITGSVKRSRAFSGDAAFHGPRIPGCPVAPLLPGSRPPLKGNILAKVRTGTRYAARQRRAAQSRPRQWPIAGS
jgi:hypothetical protein